ncbi:MAG: hypothetical protein HND58_15305 [Planctomycetota bacterium]|nr:MAG: hypothetical protein HND58_15305 [Planctomycetota bacterium]
MASADPTFTAFFPANYAVDVGVFASPHERTHWFPPTTSDGVTARIRPARSEPWFGYFPKPSWSNKLTPLFSTPAADNILFCGSESTLVVPTSDPASFRDLGIFSVQSVLPVPDLDVIVLTCFTDIYLFDGHLVSWRSSRISWDGFDDLRVDGHVLTGRAWDAPTDTFIPFEADLATRSIRGGPHML